MVFLTGKESSSVKTDVKRQQDLNLSKLGTFLTGPQRLQFGQNDRPSPKERERGGTASTEMEGYRGAFVTLVQWNGRGRLWKNPEPEQEFSGSG